MARVFVFEDHDQALDIWRKRGVRSLDLVHIDAHLDFAVHRAQPLTDVLAQARSVKELKRELEYSLAYLHYQKDLSRQTDIGNYIYPAVKGGIVRNFWWVVPGTTKDFVRERDAIKKLLKELCAESAGCRIRVAGHALTVAVLGRTLTVCTLEQLPCFDEPILLDIDTDFLVTPVLSKARNTDQIKRRNPWIVPQELAAVLTEKVRAPSLITIAYSVNGGFTPMKYRYLGDALALSLSRGRNSKRYEKNIEAGKNFTLFESTGRKRYYWRAVRNNLNYRGPDNNYGPLYLAQGRLTQAEEEFKRILKVDPHNPASLAGLAEVYVRRRSFAPARRLLILAGKAKNKRIFRAVRKESLLTRAQAAFALKKFDEAGHCARAYRAGYPLDPYAHFLLARILEKKRLFKQAAEYYQDSLRLGLDSLEPLARLAKICVNLTKKESIIQYMAATVRSFKVRIKQWRAESSRDKKTPSHYLKLQKRLSCIARTIQALS